MGSVLKYLTCPGMCLSLWHFVVYFFPFNLSVFDNRVKMSGPCTNSADLTFAKQQHARFLLLCSLPHLCQGGRQDVSRMHWTVAGPCLVMFASVCLPLRHLSRSSDGFALDGALASVTVGQSVAQVVMTHAN